MLFFQTGKKQRCKTKRLPQITPRYCWRSRSRCDPCPAHFTRAASLERKPKRCIPTRINNPSAKLLKSFTRVTAAARSSSRGAEQRCAKCSSNRRQNPQQYGIIYQPPCETGFSQPDPLRYPSAERGDKSRSHTNKTREDVPQEKNSVSKTLNPENTSAVFQPFGPLIKL